jgi:hypothetical protein
MSCFTVKGNTRHYTMLCPHACPAVPRKTRGNKNIASFAWNRDFSPPDYLLAENILAWKFMNRCRNIQCPNYTPSPSSTLSSPVIVACAKSTSTGYIMTNYF